LYTGFALVCVACALVGCVSTETAAPTTPSHAREEPAVPTEEKVVEESTAEQETVVTPRPAQGESDLPSLSEIAEQVSGRISPNRRAVADEGLPLVRIQDRVDPPRVYALTSEAVNTQAGTAETEDPVDYNELKEYSRIYDPEATEFSFFVEAFAAEGGELTLIRSVSLGTAKAIGDFRLFYLQPEQAVPTCLSLETYAAERTEVRWVIFDKDGTASRFDLENSGQATSKVVDLDDDGVLDVVKTQREPEAGLGFETYLSLHQWNGNQMVETDTVALVRSVNLFLDRALEHVERSRWEQFVAHVLDPTDRERWRASGLGNHEIIRMLLRVHVIQGRKSEPYRFLESGQSITEVFAAPVLENPFGDEGYFQHDIRLACCESDVFVLSARVKLSGDPFDKPIATFVAWE
jgi:hypothetical protein